MSHWEREQELRVHEHSQIGAVKKVQRAYRHYRNYVLNKTEQTELWSSFFKTMDERLHPGRAVGFFPYNEFHTLLELGNEGGMVSEELTLAVYNGWHDRADVLLDTEYSATKESLELNMYASVIQRSFRAKRAREINRAESTRGLALDLFRASALRVHAIEKGFLYLMMGFSGDTKDKAEAVKAESGRGKVAPEAFAWAMRRFGFHHRVTLRRQALVRGAEARAVEN
eukprot:FR742539.1.p1 GENE.FR742539.1~~FR742539.1.p1  ORF type:complete len:242 (+),score=29.03 FR742539.1:48-728(+)